MHIQAWKRVTLLLMILMKSTKREGLDVKCLNGYLAYIDTTTEIDKDRNSMVFYYNLVNTFFPKVPLLECTLLSVPKEFLC